MRMLLPLLILFISAPAMALELKGEVTQGGFIIGQVEPGIRVMRGDEEVRVAADGRFVIGIGRDDTGTLTLILHDGAKPTVFGREITRREFKIDRVDGVPPRTVDIPEEEKERREKEGAMVRAARAQTSDALHWAEGFIAPVAKARISGVYGSQRVLNGKPSWPHFGVDYAAPLNTPVKAPASGIVRLAQPDFLLEGGIIIIDHGMGVTSTLMHLEAVLVEEGASVTRGQVIAKLGAKGRATGPHVDWRINVGDIRVDPLLALEATKTQITDKAND